MAEENTQQIQPENFLIEELAAPSPTITAKLIKIIGQLDESNIDINSKTIYAIIAEHPKDLFICFDLTRLEYMNSKSIGYLTDWYGKVTEGGGKITIGGAPQTVLDILMAVGINELIKCYPTVEEAKFQLFQKDPATSN